VPKEHIPAGSAFVSAKVMAYRPFAVLSMLVAAALVTAGAWRGGDDAIPFNMSATLLFVIGSVGQLIIDERQGRL